MCPGLSVPADWWAWVPSIMRWCSAHPPSDLAMQRAKLTSSCCHLIPMPGGFLWAAGVPLGSIKELTLPATHTHPSTHSLKGDWHTDTPAPLWAQCSLLLPGTPQDGLWGSLWLSASRCSFYRLSLLTGSPQAPPNGCFLGSPPLALVSKSASGETKPQQLAEFSASRASPLSNGCWPASTKAVSVHGTILFPAGKESARTVIWSKYIIPHPACEFIGDREILLDLLFLIH